MAAALLPIVLAAGAAVSAIGSISQGVASSNAADYNAEVSRNNALTAARVGAAKEEAQRRVSNLQLGEQTAAIAQAGVGFGGSAADVQRQSRIEAALNALNIRYSSDLESQSYRQQANLLKYQGQTDLTTGFLGAGTALLSGAADYGMINGGFRKPRGFGP